MKHYIPVGWDGCLVPGCNEITSALNPKQSFKKNFKIFPNPASHELYVLCQSASQLQVELQLINQQGIILNRRSLDVETGAQYILPIDHLLPGTFHLVITGSMGEVESHTFVKY